MMKANKIIMSFAFPAILAFALASCAKTPVPASRGDSVLFKAGIGTSDVITRTSYQGHGSGETSEGINWVANDIVRIWCRECAEPTESYGGNDHFANYWVTPAEGSSASGTVVNPSNIGLRWGAGIGDAGYHWFYAVYPSPLTEGKSGDSWVLSGTSGTETAPTAFSFTGHIPAAQSVTGTSTTGDLTVASPDMSNLYMVTPATKAKPLDSGDGVFLQFTPLTTAIEFTITNAMSMAMSVESISLVSEGHTLNGAFTADISGTSAAWNKPDATYSRNYPKCTLSGASGDDNKKVTISFSQAVSIPVGKTFRFTFFLLPLTPDGSTITDINDLTFSIKRNGSSVKTKLSYSSGIGIPFPVHKKTYIKGLMVPDGLVVNYVTSIEAWGNAGSGELNVQ